MSGKICVYVRDSKHPADLYDSTGHWFAVSIHEIGSNGPLFWNGVNYNWVWLPIKGEFNKVAGEFTIPAGTYLIKGYAFCQNVVTHIAWVQVADNETVSVNLIPTSVVVCILAAEMGVMLGTANVDGKDVPITTLAQAEAAQFKKAADALVAKLPQETGISLMSIDEVQKMLKETPRG
jgi:hypothetical protein